MSNLDAFADILGPYDRVTPGSWGWEDHREAARQRAHRIEDPARRALALQAVRDAYGSKPTSRTLAVYGPRTPEPPLNFHTMTDEEIDIAAVAPVPGYEG